MKKTMLAAVAHEFGKPLRIEEIPIPSVGRHQVLVKVFASGVCHSDLHAVNGDWPVKPKLPLVPGHEGAGEVVVVGDDVTLLKVGDRVGVPWLYSACGHCDHCWGGWETLCESQKNTGYSENGCHAEYVLADPNYLGRIPKNLSYAGASSILCAGVTVYKGIKQTATKPGDWIAIVGVGGLGHMAVQYAKAMGLKVVAIDRTDDKLKLATQFKADVVINAAKDDPIAIIKQETGGVHGVLITAVSADSVSQSLAMLRRGGTVAVVGLPPGDFKLPVFDLVLSGKTVRGSIVGTRLDLEEALAFAADGRVALEYHTARLDNINAIFDSMTKGTIVGRMVIEFD